MFNKTYLHYIIMKKEGYVQCDSCKGEGYTYNKTKINRIGGVGITEVCKMCHGHGELTWTEEIFGKKIKKILGVTFSYFNDSEVPKG